MWQLRWEESLGENGNMSEFFCCSPETITALLIDYTPTKKKKFKNKQHLYDPAIPLLGIVYTAKTEIRDSKR